MLGPNNNAKSEFPKLPDAFGTMGADDVALDMDLDTEVGYITEEQDNFLLLYAYGWLMYLTDFLSLDYIVKKPMFFPMDSSAVHSKFRWADSNQLAQLSPCLTFP